MTTKKAYSRLPVERVATKEEIDRRAGHEVFRELSLLRDLLLMPMYKCMIMAHDIHGHPVYFIAINDDYYEVCKKLRRVGEKNSLSFVEARVFPDHQSINGFTII